MLKVKLDFCNGQFGKSSAFDAFANLLISFPDILGSNRMTMTSIQEETGVSMEDVQTTKLPEN